MGGESEGVHPRAATRTRDRGARHSPRPAGRRAAGYFLLLEGGLDALAVSTRVERPTNERGPRRTAALVVSFRIVLGAMPRRSVAVLHLELGVDHVVLLPIAAGGPFGRCAA